MFLFLFYKSSCRVSGARYPTDPAITKTSRLTIANHTQRHIRQPLQGEHCRSQRFYRHSVFIWYLTTTMSNSTDLPLLRLSSLIHPHVSLLVEMPGTAPGSKTIIPQRIQNHHRFRDRHNYKYSYWKMQVFKL